MAGITNPNFLNSFQKSAIERLDSGNILVGQVGSGKSRTALAYYFFKIGKGDITNKDGYVPMLEEIDLYIITTAKKRDSFEWEDEMCPFLLSTHKDVCMYDINIVVDSWNNIKKYKDIKNAFFIFDEQRLIGNGTWVKTFLQIAKNNKWILLTATPGDTWMDYIPVFLANGFYKNRTEFIAEHVIYSPFTTKFRKVQRFVGIKKLVRLKDLIVVNLEKTEKNIKRNKIFKKVNYNKEMYKKIQKNRWNYEKNEPINDISELFMLLRKEINTSEDRINELKTILLNCDKSIIFYNFNCELELLRNVCDELGINYSEWNGHNHDPLPEGEKWVYLVQYNAGAEGWNCITTNNLIFYSPNYSYKMMVQAAGRIDRMNTPFDELNYYILKSDAPIERAIWHALDNKKNFNESKYYKGL